MSILSYVKKIAIQDSGVRREAVRHALGDLGCPFGIQKVKIDGVLCENFILPLGEGAPRLLIGAHYDSVPGSTGANDNASGVAILLDLINQISRKPIPSPIDFVFFDLEENNLSGSRAYMRHVSTRGISAMVNMDICGVGDTILIAPRANLTGGLLKRIVPRTVPYAGYPVQLFKELPPGDEHSFLQAGIPAITVGIAPRDDVSLIQSFVGAAGESPKGLMPSIIETVHNGPRDSIEMIEESALQIVQNWLMQLLEFYFLEPAYNMFASPSSIQSRFIA